MIHKQQGALIAKIHFLPCLEPPVIPLHLGYHQGLAGSRTLQDTLGPPWDSPTPQPVPSQPSNMVPECPVYTAAGVTSVKRRPGR